MNFVRNFPKTVGMLFAIAVAFLLGILLLGLYIGFTFAIIWALNILGLHIAYGASEFLAVAFLCILFRVF